MKKDIIKELKYELYRKENTNTGLILALVLVIVFLPIITITILGVAGAFDSPITELGLDKEVVIRNHVLESYPEYSNCDIEYKRDIYWDGKEPKTEGVVIWCDVNKENRDNLKVASRIKSPIMRLEFDDITVEDMLKRQIDKLLWR